MRYSCGHVSTKKNVRGLKDVSDSMPPSMHSSRYIRYCYNIGDNQYGESYNIGDNQYSSKNLLYCPINRFLELVTLLRRKKGVVCVLTKGHQNARACSYAARSGVIRPEVMERRNACRASGAIRSGSRYIVTRL